MSSSGSIAFCSACTRSYLPVARVLGNGLRQHHPDAPLHLLVFDARVTPQETAPFLPISAEDLLGVSNLTDLTFYYDAFELCNGLRGALHRYMLEKTSADRWLYIDADMMCLGNLQPAFDQLESCPILLCPHMSTPFPQELVDPTEVDIARHGIFNGGFVGLRRSEMAERFIEWFSDRLERYAFCEYRGMFGDQLWLNLVPSLFHPVGFCTHPGIDVGHWNLHERTLSEAPNGEFLANDRPLLLLHMSGWRAQNPTAVSVHAPKYNQHPPAGWNVLAKMYLSELIRHGFEMDAVHTYGHGRFEDGTAITLLMRRHYYGLLARGQRLPRSPFQMSHYFLREVGSSFPLRFARKARQLLAATNLFGL